MQGHCTGLTRKTFLYRLKDFILNLAKAGSGTFEGHFGNLDGSCLDSTVGRQEGRPGRTEGQQIRGERGICAFSHLHFEISAKIRPKLHVQSTLLDIPLTSRRRGGGGVLHCSSSRSDSFFVRRHRNMQNLVISPLVVSLVIFSARLILGEYLYR